MTDKTHLKDAQENHDTVKTWTPTDWYIRAWKEGHLWRGFVMDFEGALFGDPMIPAVFATGSTADDVHDELVKKLHAMDMSV